MGKAKARAAGKAKSPGAGKAKRGRQAQRQTARKATRKASKRKSRLYLAYVVFAVVLAGIMVSFLALNPGSPTSSPTAKLGQAVPDMGHEHIPSLDTPHEPYNSDPPTSGPHVQALAPAGIHDAPIPKELQVHNLEDGFVMVQYSEKAPQAVVDRLAGVVEGYQGFVILAPYPGMEPLIALTAWARIDTLEDFDEARIVSFIDAYRGIDHHER